jgi:hypothetical protein
MAGPLRQDLAVAVVINRRCLSPHGLERGSNLLAEQFGLLPSCEVPAFGNLVVVDELRVGLGEPSLRRLVHFAGKDGDADRNS